MSQTTGYGYISTVAQAGQKVDLVFDTVDSFAAEGAVPFGVAVIRGTADDQCQVADSDAGDFLGVSLFTHTIEQTFPATGNAAYADTDTVSVVSDGRVWMEAVGAVTAGAAAYAIVAAGATQGQATATSTDNLLIGKFITSGEDELVAVQVEA
ncbi:MAG: hypothetical protein Unbinned3138contig1000_47 [Prokaryotic dsDNA virus sp.]|nr:MAG: hypothetical protein Unbinned3138contig1000_47 [Prokaryotic dsDNA virus sp.]|tara:strand:- start:12246 stop:12704 length:459 start_codon:yes stop_codon:yes gene_type:complete